MAGITRLDDQIFLNRNPGVPSVVKFHPFTPCVAVADKDSIWYVGHLQSWPFSWRTGSPWGVWAGCPCTLLVWKLLSPGLWAVSGWGWGLENLQRDVPPPGVARALPGLHLATLPRVLQRPEHGYVWAGTGASGTKMGPFLCSEQTPVHRGSSGSHSDRTCEEPACVQGQQVCEGKVSVIRHHVNS